MILQPERQLPTTASRVDFAGAGQLETLPHSDQHCGSAGGTASSAAAGCVRWVTLGGSRERNMPSRLSPNLQIGA